MRRLVHGISKSISSLFGNFEGSEKYIGGVLAPNGKIYCIPVNSTQILVIYPSNDTTFLSGNFSGTVKWQGGVLASNGKIYCVPRNSTQILVIDTKSIPTTLDLQIPVNLADIPTSNYNKYFNKY